MKPYRTVRLIEHGREAWYRARGWTVQQLDCHHGYYCVLVWKAAR